MRTRPALQCLLEVGMKWDHQFRLCLLRLVGIHTVVVDGSGAPCDVRRNEGLVATYDGDSIAVFEKVDLATLSWSVDDSKFLTLTKSDEKYFAAIAVVEPGFITVTLPGSDLELELSDIEWIAKWKHTIPRASV